MAASASAPRRLAGVLVCAAAVAALSGCGSSAKPAAPSPVRSTPLSSIFEADPQLHADPAGTLDVLRSLGVDAVRVFVPWGFTYGLPGIAPDPESRTPPSGFDASDPGSYPPGNWASFDTIVRDAQARGIAVDLTLGPPPPLWAQGRGDPGHPVHPQWEPSARDFGQFVHAIATRYSGHYRPAGESSPLPRVDFWALWNEPNFGPMLAPQTVQHSTLEVSPMLYRAMVDAGWQALQETGHGGDTILVGELAPRGIDVGAGPGTFGYMVPLRFLRALYCVDAALHQLRGDAAAERGCPTTAAGSAEFAAQHPGLFRAAGFAVHPYEFGPPNVPTPDEPAFVDLATLPRFEHQLDAITALYGVHRHYPVYSTEFGYETNPPEKVVGTVTPQLAATYLNQSEYLTWRDPRLRTYDQYLLVDPANGEFATGLEFANGAPKPGFAAYRLPIWLPQTRARRGDAVEIWGCVRAADIAAAASRRPQKVAIEWQPVSGGAFRTVMRVTLTDPHGYFDVHARFAGSGTVRLGWKPPGRAAIHSRLVGVIVR